MLSQKDKMTLAALLGPPLAGWGLAVHLTETVRNPGALEQLVRLMGVTPDRPALLAGAGVGLALGCVGALLVQRQAAGTFAGAPYKKFLRGTRAVTARQLERLTRDRGIGVGEAARAAVAAWREGGWTAAGRAVALGRANPWKPREQVTIGGIPMPVDIENQHLLVAAGTGSGKSNLFRELALGLLHRGDKMVCIDPDGSMMSKFFCRGDTILNPYDERTAGWSFFNEIRRDHDFEQLVASMVPGAATGEAEEWAEYGRLLLQETARKLHKLGTPSMEDVFKWTTTVPPDKLQEFLKGTPAESVFAGSANTVASTRFTLSKYLAPHLKMPKGDFSLRAWLEDERASTLWITWRQDSIKSLRPLISAWIDTLFVAVVALPEDRRRRIWFLLDELASLEKLPTLEDGLTKGRKKGARVAGSLQSISQFNVIYGIERAKVLRSCMKSLVVMGLAKADPDTAAEMSRALGQHEVERVRESENVGTRNSGVSRQMQHEKEDVVTAGQLTELPDLSGYLAYAGNRPIARIDTKWRDYPARVPAFVERTR